MEIRAMVSRSRVGWFLDKIQNGRKIHDEKWHHRVQSYLEPRNQRKIFLFYFLVIGINASANLDRGRW